MEYETCEVKALQSERKGFLTSKNVYRIVVLVEQNGIKSEMMVSQESEEMPYLEEQLMSFITKLTSDGWELVGDQWNAFQIALAGRHMIFRRPITKSSGSNISTALEALMFLKKEGLLKQTEFDKLLERVQRRM